MRISAFAFPLFVLSLAGLSHAGITGLYECEMFGPSPYFQASDSPFFDGIQAGTIYLEDFEDGELNTPFVVSRDFPDFPASNIFGSTLRSIDPNARPWSVDGDDGFGDGFTGFGGDTWLATNRSTNSVNSSMDFQFLPDVQGRLPTYVGFVAARFFDVDFDLEVAIRPDADLGPVFFDDDGFPVGDSVFSGDTRSHRFYGYYLDAGIERLTIRNIAQIDHLQYGYAIPESTVVSLFGLAAFLLFRRRR